MQLIEKHIVKEGSKDYTTLDRLCFLSKNLYNATLYEFRQYFFNEGKFLGYVNCYNKFKTEHNVDYYSLPTKVSQGVMRMVEKNYRSFFSLMKKRKPGDDEVNIPKYLDKKNGRYMLFYSGQAISRKDKGHVKLSGTDISIKTDKNVKSVRVIPNGNHYTIELIYDCEEKSKIKDNGVYAGIDIGLNNLATVCFTNRKGFIINGRPLKSINQYYNKKKSHYKSIAERRNNRKYTKRTARLDSKRKFKVDDYLHKSSSLLVNQLISNGVSRVVIGNNTGWKQEINIGRRNNQNFVQIPHSRFIQILEYKCELNGIEVLTREESYTSKCSFLDNEEIRKHDVYLGKRVKRGLFVSGKGIKINADLNGALNILRKEVGKFDYDPIEVCSSPLRLHIGLS